MQIDGDVAHRVGAVGPPIRALGRLRLPFQGRLGYVVFSRILATAGAIDISLVTLLISVGAVLLGSLVLGEQVSGVQIAGMVLIAFGLIAIDGRALVMARGWSASRCRVAAARGTP